MPCECWYEDLQGAMVKYGTCMNEIMGIVLSLHKPTDVSFEQ